MDLLRITVKKDRGVVALRNLSSGIATELDQYSKDIVNDLSKVALNAYKSKVPIDTGELRGQIIRLSPRGNKTAYTAKIYIPDSSIHVSGRFGVIERNSASLADLLNQNSTYKRTQTSLSAGFSPIVRGQPTAGWQEQAYLSTLSYLKTTSTFGTL